MKKLPTFEEYLNESTLADTKNKIPQNDWGYQMIFNAIRKYLSATALEIEEVELIPFEGDEIVTFSTAVKGNFVLTLGLSNGKPACKLLDELNDITTYYYKK